MKAEELAGLPKLEGTRWHAYRRRFATELKALPVTDVAAAGGWSSTQTVQRIYQQAEARGVLSAVEEDWRELIFLWTDSGTFQAHEPIHG